MTKINNTNYQDMGRNINLADQISRFHNKPMELIFMVFGALGEIVNTCEFSNAKNALKNMGIKGKQY